MAIEKRVDTIKTDCTHFGGYKPCSPHKREGVHCDECSHYEKIDKKILILKLGAAGEILRNTPLLRKIKEEYPMSRIFWLTEYPELLPKDDIFRSYDFSERELELIKDVEFDVLYSLDKHEEVGALANRINAKVKKGFSQKDGVIVPFDKDAKHKWITGIYDDVMKKNKKHYIEEIFEICGFKFNGEKYILPDYKVPEVEINKDKKVIALNTGASQIWKPRIYSEENWVNLGKGLLEKDYEVMVVGGNQEHEKNKEISKKSGAKYFGTFNKNKFIGLLSLADVVVTPVTFAFHAAVGLEKKVILLNNVFNKSEFNMYDKGTVLEPDVPCLMCYKKDYDEKCVSQNCIDLIKPEEIIGEIEKFN